MSHVVVTGAAGFLGGHVVEALLTRGHHVLGVDRAPIPAHLRGPDGLGWLQQDLTAQPHEVDRALLAAALRCTDAVLHLAGCPGVRDAAADVEHRRQRDNVDATVAVLAQTPCATPVLVTSSSSVYGGSRWSRPSVEGDPLEPRGGYAASKVRAEKLCAQRRAAGGAVLVVRPFTLTGERQRPDMALARWIEAARAGRPLQVFGTPTRSRDITDVRQAAEALVRLAHRADDWATAGAAVNVGTGQAHTLAALAEAVRTATDSDVPVVVEPAAPVEVRHTLADTRRLASLVGVVPHTDLAGLVARQVAARDAHVSGHEPVEVPA